MHYFRMRGALCGQQVSPTRILDGITDGTPKVLAETRANHLTLDAVPRRVLFVGLFGAGALCIACYGAVTASVATNAILSHVVRFVGVPVIVLATSGIAFLKSLSLDDESGAKSTLVVDGQQLVHVKSYVTVGAEGDTVLRIALSHVVIGWGQATRTLGGVSFELADRYKLSVSLDGSADIDDIAIGEGDYLGPGTVYVPDVFETPLHELLGDWLDDDEWLWAKPSDEHKEALSGKTAQMVV